MPRNPGVQFPDLTPANLGERFIDPAALDREVAPDPEPIPTWPPIIVAAIGAAAVVALTWWGGLFEGLLTRLTGGVL